MQAEVSMKLIEIEKEMRSLQMQIDLLDLKLNTFKKHHEEDKEWIRKMNP